MQTLSLPGAFRKDWLPRAQDFYPDNVARFKALRGHRAIGLCPFHPDHDPSLRIDLDRGLYHCFPCGIGGDIIDFVMRRDHVDFVTAAKSLGAWDDGGERFLPPRELHPVRYLVWEFTIDGQSYRAEMEDEPRDYEDKIRRFYRDASDRLTELSHGDSENYVRQLEVVWSDLELSFRDSESHVGELESCWARMSCAQDELWELETT